MMKNPIERATERAERYAPIPVNTALVSGIVGIGVVSIAIAAFTGFYSVDATSHWTIFIPLLALGFFIPFASSFVRLRRHKRAVASEMAQHSKEPRP